MAQFVNLTGTTDGTIFDSQGVDTFVNVDSGASKGNGHGNNARLIAARRADDPVSKARKRKCFISTPALHRSGRAPRASRR